ncbi:HNH endonuclease [Kitasatospora purpeofusca]|uniref:HNH endonuclease n=1 Tax=Kitasatospora purpeofusca TaxID=67352 RepID=UPI003F4A9083
MQMGIFSRESVLKAIDECDKVGASAFRDTYGFGKALSYVLEFDGRSYDSKAIAGVAHQYEYGRALTSDEFSGGKDGAAAWLKQAGFVVKLVRNPTWTTDEAVLACALVVDNGWRGLPAEDTRIGELSSLLQRMTTHEDSSRSETFRNPNGVARKTYDLATNHPDYPGQPTNAGKNDHTVIRAFIDKPAEMLAAAQRIRELISRDDFTPMDASDEDVDSFEAPEGRLLLRQHLRRERNPKLKQAKIKAVLKSGGSLVCEVCSFDFEAVYGERGVGYIECHHIVPLHVVGESTTRLSDLALICSNCHRMIHRSAPWPTPMELRVLVQKQAGGIQPLLPNQRPKTECSHTTA